MIRFFDNCSTTRVDDEVMSILCNYAQNKYFNPSARSTYSLNVANALSFARSEIAEYLGVLPEEIYFTSGGTEANNTAIFGAVKSLRGNIVLTASEHSAVYNAVSELNAKNIEVRFARVLPDGHIDVDDFVSMIDGNTVLACFMHVNNETGAVNDVKYINEQVKRKNPRTITFSDGVQAIGKIDVDIKSLGVDFYSCSGHKLHASKGTGFLYVKKGVKFAPLVYGGGQERGLRSGTEYVGGAISLAAALKKAVSNIKENTSKFTEYKKIIRDALANGIDYLEICKNDVSPAIMTLAFCDLKGEVLLHMLERYEIIVGTGSACSSKNKQSRIAKAIGLDKRYVEGIIRISFSKYNTLSDVEFLAQKLAECASELNKIMRPHGR